MNTAIAPQRRWTIHELMAECDRMGFPAGRWALRCAVVGDSTPRPTRAQARRFAVEYSEQSKRVGAPGQHKRPTLCLVRGGAK